MQKIYYIVESSNTLKNKKLLTVMTQNQGGFLMVLFSFTYCPGMTRGKDTETIEQLIERGVEDCKKWKKGVSYWDEFDFTFKFQDLRLADFEITKADLEA